jgi:cytochrome c oxidase subunit II
MTPKSSMHINRLERTWMIIGAATLVGFLLAITVAALAWGIQLPAPYARVDPKTVAKTEPWSNPGLRELAPGKYEVYILARVFQFNPAKITVPVGSQVTFYITSVDVQHGFRLQDTNISMQIIPGQVSTLTTVFDKPGTYNFICTEFCGTAHQTMYGQLIVTP